MEKRLDKMTDRELYTALADLQQKLIAKNSKEKLKEELSERILKTELEIKK